MKRIFLALAIVTMFSGCASTQPMTFDTAKANCANAGFGPGTNLFLNCIKQQMEQASKPTAFQQYMINRASNPAYRSSDVVCRPWGNGIRCEEW